MRRETRLIIVVEDSDEDYAVLTRLLRRLNVSNTLHRCTSGDDCLDYLEMIQAVPKSSYPALILLDLNLPGTSGREVLEQIKHHPILKSIPVTVVTTSVDERDVTDCYRRGANSYIVKQGDLDGYQRILGHLVNYWFDAVTLP
jgi:CheY-like chemotaxis protein